MPRLHVFPPGGRLFIDANIFLEHLIRSELACTAFFQRLRQGAIHGVTSVAVLAEVRHRLLLTEIVRRGYVTRPHRALETLRSRPELLRHLGDCDAGLNLLLQVPIRLVSLTPAQFRAAQRISLRYHLLTNDALHVATLRAHGLHHLATADADFRRVPRLILWTL